LFVDKFAFQVVLFYSDLHDKTWKKLLCFLDVFVLVYHLFVSLDVPLLVVKQSDLEQLDKLQECAHFDSMLAKFYIVQVYTISWAFSELSFQRYLCVIDQIIHFLPSVFHERKLSIKPFMVLLILLVKHSNGNDHEQTRIGLVANRGLDSSGRFQASK
jgi:hypothetical protein